MHEETTNNTRPFGPVHIVQPQSAHTHTVIVLHGRGSNGPEFAEELFATHLSDNDSLSTKFPGWRWVFPSSKELWSPNFQDHVPSWFEMQSLTDTRSRPDDQIPGIMDSCEYVQTLIDDEVDILRGKTDNLIFGGISQGGAIAMCMLLCGGMASQIGAFFAASTWLPFAKSFERLLPMRGNGETDTTGQSAVSGEYDTFIHHAMRDPTSKQHRSTKPSNLKVFLGHGLDDAYVDIELGRQASHVLSQAGFDVEWKEYSGAEQEGHWLQEPNEMDDIYQFMLKCMI